jgi:hypothetical protein
MTRQILQPARRVRARLRQDSGGTSVAASAATMRGAV